MLHVSGAFCADATPVRLSPQTAIAAPSVAAAARILFLDILVLPWGSVRVRTQRPLVSPPRIGPLGSARLIPRGRSSPAKLVWQSVNGVDPGGSADGQGHL